MVLKELILISFHFGMGMVVLNELIFFTVSTFRGCGDLERTHFNSFYVGRVWSS